MQIEMASESLKLILIRQFENHDSFAAKLDLFMFLTNKCQC